MQCPACGNRMTEVKTGDITVDACTGGCGGLWFDHFELRKVDEPTQSAGESLLNIPQNPKVKVDQSQRRKCPRDPDIDRKSTRLNSSHVRISYAVFCLKKKNSKLLRRAPSCMTRRAASDT